MKTDKFEKFITAVLQDKTILRELFSIDTSESKRCHCLSDEDITKLLEGKLEKETSDTLFSHMAYCDPCLDLFQATHEIIHSTPDKKKENQFAASFFEEVTRFTLMVKSLPGKIVPIVLDSGFVPMSILAPAAIRSSNSRSKNFIKIAKEVSLFLIEITIEKYDEESCGILIDIKYKETGKFVDNLRVSLFHNGDEIESIVTEKGRVSFEELDMTEYLVCLSEKENKICEFDISFV